MFSKLRRMYYDHIDRKEYKKYATPEEKAKPNDSYYILINSKCPGIIVECGFLSNSDEATKLTNETYQKELAEILSEGISTYFNMQR